MYSSHISKAVKLTLATILTVPSLFTFNVNSAQAGLDSQAIDRVNNPSSIVKTTTDLAANNHNRSIQYQQIEISTQAEQDYDLPVEDYEIALNIDPINGDVWLLAGELLGNTEEGIKFVRIAAQLFKLQGDERGYQSAIDLLKKFGASD
ncbi:hypothetical protein [Chamaesiphon sp. VAR_48_metabat_403]|uniref:hypothetical protein n=1 Tax=Chamaesiphon sp. VAR_48_metabat_403 TaxID=2964700 RepID=UPI00286E2FFC|nr:hypothetical protein [Chamaesiphon sp. VAR_48_metabat_403]